MEDFENEMQIEDQIEIQNAIGNFNAVIAHFYSTDMPEFKNVLANFHNLAQNNPDLYVLHIDILKHSKCFTKFKVPKLPYFILYANGKKLKDVCGIDEKFFKEWLPKLLPTINLLGFKIGSK